MAHTETANYAYQTRLLIDLLSAWLLHPRRVSIDSARTAPVSLRADITHYRLVGRRLALNE